MKLRTRAVSVAALAVAVLGLGGLGWTNRPPPSTEATTAEAQAPGAPPVIVSGSLAEIIAGLQARVRALPEDWSALADLGLAYVQQARATADPTYYPKAEAVLRASLGLNARDDVGAMVGMAALAAARHDFAGALSWGRRAEAIDPENGNVHDVIGDALVELGRYPEAFDELQEAVDRKPDLASYARASYAHELQGDVTGAVRIMRLALAAAGTAQDRAWTLAQLGDLAFNSGDLAGARRYYDQAWRTDPTFVPARAGIAKAEAAAGQSARAIADYGWVVDRYPLPEYVIALGDLLSSLGRKADAAAQFGLLGVEEELFRANGVDVDLEIALFDADHRVDLADGLDAARAEWARRQSIQVADALAWELYANGHAAEAIVYSERALALGTRNALFLFHRGMIERALGRNGAARRDLATALATNPHFSILWSARAARILAGLGGSA